MESDTDIEDDDKSSEESNDSEYYKSDCNDESHNSDVNSTNNEHENENVLKHDHSVSLAHIYAAYATYSIRESKKNKSSLKTQRANNNTLYCLCSSDKQLVYNLLERYYEIYQKNLAFNAKIDYKLSKEWHRIKRGDDLLSKLTDIYIRILSNEEFRNTVHRQINFNIALKENIRLDIESMRLCEKIFDYQGNQCDECKNKLTLSARFTPSDSSKSRRGKIAIAFSDTEPPKLCNSFHKRCNKCNITYTYGIKKNFKTGVITRLPIETRDWFEVSTCTYIHKNLFKHMTEAVIGSPQSIQSFIETYNERFSIQKKLITNQCNKFGKRENLDLNYNRVKNSFYIYHLQRYIETYFEGQNLSLNQNELNKIKSLENRRIRLEIKNTTNNSTTSPHKTHQKTKSKKKNKRTKDTLSNFNNDKSKRYNKANTSQSINSNNSSKKNSASNKIKTTKNAKKKKDKNDKLTLCSLEEFKYLFNKLQQQILDGPIPGLENVPIKDNKIHPGHFIVYGDGNQKGHRWRCALPSSIIKYMHILHKNELNDNAIDKETIKDILKRSNNDELLQDITPLLDKLEDQVMKIENNHYQCENSPQGGTLKFKGFMTCCDHTRLLVNFFEIDAKKIDTFISWYRIQDKIDRLNKASISSISDEDERQFINSRKPLQIAKLKSLIDTVPKEDTKEWTKIRNFIIKRLDPSTYKRTTKRRNSNTKTIANINENIETLNDTELCENIQYACDENISDTEILKQSCSAARDALLDSAVNDMFSLTLQRGCRKKQNMKTTTATSTHGLNALFTTTRFCIELREEVYTESPTKIIFSIAKALTRNQTGIKYYQRIEALGYDFMCNIYKTLRSLYSAKKLSERERKFWLPLMDRLFIDLFHVRNHKNPICIHNPDTGILNPKLDKFNSILITDSKSNKWANDQVVEQFWSAFNKYTYLRALGKEKYRFFLILKREHNNLKRIKVMQKQGWIFIPISFISNLRIWDSIPPDAPLPSTPLLQKNNNLLLEKLRFTSQNIGIKEYLPQGDTYSQSSVITLMDTSSSQTISQQSSSQSSVSNNSNKSKKRNRKQAMQSDDRNMENNQNSQPNKRHKSKR